MMIRPYCEADLVAFSELMSDLGYPTQPEMMFTRMKRIESTTMYHTFVAEEQGQLVGMIGIRQLYT